MKRISKSMLISRVTASLFTAVLCALSQIYVPMPFGIPVTLQVFAVCLCGYVLGARWGSACVGVYIATGAVGVPVFSGFKGGAQVLFGPTGGFLWGFIVLAILCGCTFVTDKKYLKVLLSVVGLTACHICGILQFAFIAKTDILKSAVTVSLPFVLKDALLLVLGYCVSKNIRKFFLTM